MVGLQAHQFFLSKNEHDDSETDEAFSLPKDSPLGELSESGHIDFLGRKLTLIQLLEDITPLTVGMREYKLITLTLLQKQMRGEQIAMHLNSNINKP